MTELKQHYDYFFHTKNKAHKFTLLRIVRDPYRDTNMNLYYIGEDVNVGVEVVGDTCFIATIGNSLFSVCAKGELEGLIAKAKNKVPIDIEVPVVARKKLEVPIDIPPVIQRKQLLKRRELTHG